MEMVNPFIELICSSGGLFGLCEFGERLREAFDEINLMLNLMTKWYLLPLKAQKILSIMLCVTERPVELAIFGSITSNRNTFKVVSAPGNEQFLPMTKIFVYSFPTFRFPTKHIRHLWCFNDLTIEFIRLTHSLLRRIVTPNTIIPNLLTDLPLKSM